MYCGKLLKAGLVAALFLPQVLANAADHPLVGTLPWTIPTAVDQHLKLDDEAVVAESKRPQPQRRHEPSRDGDDSQTGDDRSTAGRDSLTTSPDSPGHMDGVDPIASRLDGPRSASGSNDQRRLTFNFKNAYWEDVLEWFVDEADLAANITYYPTGTFSYQDTHEFTATEALDLLNCVLLNEGWSIVRRGRLLMLLNLAQDIPLELLELVPLSELDERGEFELVKTIFPLASMSVEDAEAEIGRLLGPGRSMIVLPKARQILVAEMAGKLRVMRDVIRAIEYPDRDDKKVIEWVLENVLAETVLKVARPLLALGPTENTNEQINIATDEFGTRIFALGTEEATNILREIVDLMNVVHHVDERPTHPDVILRTYAISAADPLTVHQVLRTVVGAVDVRLAVDPMSKKLVALARPSDHLLIADTLQQLEGDATRFEVIQLRFTPAERVVVSINKLLGITEDGGGPDGLKVEADARNRRLVIRGTAAQITQIQDLVMKLEADYKNRTLRFIPIDNQKADLLLSQLKMFWPRVSKTKIRVVAPSDPNANSGVREVETSPRNTRPLPSSHLRAPSSGVNPNPIKKPIPTTIETTAITTRTTALKSPFVFLTQPVETPIAPPMQDGRAAVIQRETKGIRPPNAGGDTLNPIWRRRAFGFTRPAIMLHDFDRNGTPEFVIYSPFGKGPIEAVRPILDR